jgi:hypothetical protein
VGHEVAFVLKGNNIWSNIYEGLRNRSDTSQSILTISADKLRELVRLYRLFLKPKLIEKPKLIDQKPGEAIKPTEAQKDTPSESEHEENFTPEIVPDLAKDASFNIAKFYTRANSNRFTRTLQFANRAQKTAMLAEKITFYCTALEALFSTSQNELTHQVAERVAVIAGSDRADRLPTYRFIKECYTLRSKYIHGSTQKPTEEAAIAVMCKRLDGLVRRSFNNASEDEELCLSIIKDENLDEIMLKRLFL